MTPLTFILVLSLILLWKLDLVATLLNLKNLQPNLPTEFSDVFDAEQYVKSQHYVRANSLFHLFSSIIPIIGLLAFWLFGGYVWLHELVTNLEWRPIPTGLAYLGVLFTGSYLTAIPFNIYSTFVLEQKFGFNKMSSKTFITDQLKSLGLTVCLGLPLVALLLWIFQSVSYAWLWAWVAMTIISLLITYLAPTYIMPIFNTFTPLEDGKLKQAIHAMAEKCNFPLTELFVIDGSKRSSKANAFFTGFGKNKKIALYDTLIEKQSTDELVAVLAHEIGHFKKRHIIQRMLLSIVQTAAIFYLIGICTTPETPISNAIYKAFYFPEGVHPIYVGFAVFGILIKPVLFLLSLGLNAWSRKHEFEADLYAKRLQGTPEHLISALKKLSAQNLSNLTPHPLIVAIQHSHPPVLERIKALRNS